MKESRRSAVLPESTALMLHNPIRSNVTFSVRGTSLTQQRTNPAKFSRGRRRIVSHGAIAISHRHGKDSREREKQAPCALASGKAFAMFRQSCPRIYVRLGNERADTETETTVKEYLRLRTVILLRIFCETWCLSFSSLAHQIDAYVFK